MLSVFEKHVDAFELFSDIISKPLFCEIREDGLSLLAQEFCEGLCLDEIDDEKYYHADFRKSRPDFY